ncbi:MAG TPA: zinc ribbon domain-containing protein [Peptococcaceae bacterium]|nr:MAG: Regulatory protein, FmdB family [Clostridia bacterium 41_269]HBT20597.1 zinc ribbon domain-containing protein [Peptococcaceae bacterium]
MPTYDFLCRKCEHRFSRFVSLSNKDKVSCPRCGENDIEQLFTAFNYRISGGSSGRSAVSSGGSCSRSSCSTCAGC